MAKLVWDSMFRFERDRFVSGFRSRLLAGIGAAAFSLSFAQAHAQEVPAATDPVAEQPGPDGLTADGLYLEADAITRDTEAEQILAVGTVQARYQGRLLRADRVDYNITSGLLSAAGNAELINPDGTVQYADTLELDDQLRAGFATGFAARLGNNIKISAASAVRRTETVNELYNAIFTPCDLCNSEGEPSEPTWSIQADTVVQDQDNAIVFYRNATIRVAGVPIFYSPVFWHPDPTAERQSGFLIPTATGSDSRGFSFEQPYLWVISPHQDLIVSPQINTSVNPFLNLDWRRRFYSGTVRIRAGGTRDRLFGNVDQDPGPGVDLENTRYGDQEWRGYVLGRGAFAINEDWRWGFTIEHASDPTLFDRYDIEDAHSAAGLFQADYRRLANQVYVERQTDRSYFSMALLSFQSMRILGIDTTAYPLGDARGLIFEDDDTLPVVAPLIEARWEPASPVFGGRLRLRGSAAALFREDYVGTPVISPDYLPPPGPTDDLPGVDSARATFEADWRRAITTDFGLRLEPFMTARADLYSIEDLPTLADQSHNLSRFNATLGLDLRYPLIRRFETGSIILEPMAQIAVSPDADIDTRIPNEDSQLIELDSSTLFQDNKFPGYDLYEGGLRASLGMRIAAEWAQTRSASLFVGRMFRAEEEPGYLRQITGGAPGELYDPTGISETSSDWVVAATAQPLPGVAGWARALLDDNLDLRQIEVGLSAQFREADYVALRYLSDQTDPSPLGSANYQVLQVSGQVFVVGDWGVSFMATRDLDQELWPRSEIGLLYQDECVRFEFIYERNEDLLAGRGIRASEGVFVRLTLATLGGSR
ncbi:MAG: LPS-assembly protein LptD [Caulobacterales bacterium]|nr:LPS-assembly protein LptD [Caulobacterales bacterium]